MRIISHRELREFYESKGREDSRVALARWYQIAEDAEWHSFSEIRADFPDADTGHPYDGAKEHYILDIEHRDKALEVIRTLLPAIPYPKKRKK